MVSVGRPKRKERIKARITEFFELPSEVMLDLPRLILTGDQQLLVENHRGLKAYNGNEVCLETTVGLLTVSGAEMNIKLITADQVQIGGQIHKVEWSARREES